MQDEEVEPGVWCGVVSEEVDLLGPEEPVEALVLDGAHPVQRQLRAPLRDQQRSDIDLDGLS